MTKLARCSLLTLLGLVLGVAAAPPLRGQTDVSTAQLVRAMRLLNTGEYSYRGENHRFAPKNELIAFLKKNRQLSRSPLNLEDPKPYDLAITTSKDGDHYQITLQRPSDMHEKTTWCKTAAFSDDRGVIFLGLALDCEAAPR